MRWTMLFMGILSLFVFSTPAVAQQGDTPREAATEVARAEATEAANGVYVCSGCGVGWVWTRVQEAWRYESGSSEFIWSYILGGYTGSYAYTSTADTRARMFIQAASSGHWVGLYYLGASNFSNVRLWYY